MNKKITFLITTHNETYSLSCLLEKLKTYVIGHPGANVMVLDDFSTEENTQKILDSYVNVNGFSICQHKLEKDFSVHKNFGNSKCSGDYIFAIDADEIPSDFLLDNLHTILESNPEVDLYWLPRVNILRGLNETELRRWGWNLSKLEEFKDTSHLHTIQEFQEYNFLKQHGFIIKEEDSDLAGWTCIHHYLPMINWTHGDYQGRLYKNSPEIKWERPLHEYVTGAKVVSKFPHEIEYALIHDKTIENQVSQNMFYNSNWNQNDNVRQIK